MVVYLLKFGSAEDEVLLQSVGGDELNVCIATARINEAADAPSWVSVLPKGTVVLLLFGL